MLDAWEWAIPTNDEFVWTSIAFYCHFPGPSGLSIHLSQEPDEGWESRLYLHYLWTWSSGQKPWCLSCLLDLLIAEGKRKESPFWRPLVFQTFGFPGDTIPWLHNSNCAHVSALSILFLLISRIFRMRLNPNSINSLYPSFW